MRAINLVPADSRPGRVNGGKSGGAVYGLFGLLIVLIAAASVFAMAKRDEARANSELAAVQQSTDAYKTAATQYASFEQAAKQADERINTVRSLAQARFDWAGAMRDLSRLVPNTTRISALSASVSNGASSAGGGSGSALRSALPVPAIAMQGCTMSQNSVALLINQLQAMRRVTNVTLESSKKAEDKKASATSDSPTALPDTECDTYTFELVVFFAPGNAKLSTDAVANSGATTVSTESAGGTAPTTPGSSAESN
ncbi:MAG: PilN domain-containing protein [Solirubrobacteraceae bacterium]|nr:PilN domain-containing protein [Solirubrobacteraceae bacterium]